MKYYSETTKKLYDSAEALQAAEEKEQKRVAEIEAARKKEQEQKEKLASERKVRAKEVNDAFEEYMKTSNELYKKYVELKENFIKDYHEYHMTFTGSDLSLPSFFDAFNDFFHFNF